MASPVKIKATVTEVVHHADGVASYRFKPRGRVPKFHAGQFLHLALDAYNPQAQWPESRVFSIASAPSQRREELAITIAEKGSYTQRIIKELNEGDECWLKLPYGEFLFPPDANLTLIAGGVGLTPFLSLLQDMLETKSSQPIALHYGFRSAELFLFRELLDTCAEQLPNFSKTVYAEQETPDAITGTLDIEAIMAGASPDTHFYLSGPLAMITTFKASLLERGIPPERIRVDDWE